MNSNYSLSEETSLQIYSANSSTLYKIYPKNIELYPSWIFGPHGLETNFTSCAIEGWKNFLLLPKFYLEILHFI